jgi:hydrogenase 3 maturation protease
MPENHAAALRKGKPRVLLIADAADMGLPPGECRRLSLGGLNNVLESTHGIPLPLLLAPFDVEIEVLGIQPESLKLGAPLTDAVEQAALRVAELIQRGQWRSIRKE